MIELNVAKKLHAADGFMQLQLDLKIEQGQFVTLFGASGAGKTSTLRMLAGLLSPDKGRIVVNGQVWFDSTKKINLKPQQRKIGYVFQDYALFPNMTVKQNLVYALPKNTNHHRLYELIEKMELGDLINRRPNTLSGGQQQRVALARALVQKPPLLLLDEPLAALDLTIRTKLQDYLHNLHQQFSLTTILISHNSDEIKKLSDWVFVLENGQLIQKGSPNDIFANSEQFLFQQKGKVLQILKKADGYWLTLLLEETTVNLKTTPSQAKQVQIGDLILLEVKTESIRG